MPPPRFSSNSIKTEEINKLYDEAKKDYLKTAMTMNKPDLDAAVENAYGKMKKWLLKLLF